MSRLLRLLLLLLVLPLGGCSWIGQTIFDELFGIERKEKPPAAHIDDAVFERKGFTRDSAEGRKLQGEADAHRELEWYRETSDREKRQQKAEQLRANSDKLWREKGIIVVH